MKRIFQVLAMLMVFGLCFVSCSSGGGSSDDDVAVGGSSGSSARGALIMDLIHLYDDDDNEITGTQKNELAAQIGAVEMIVHSSSDNEYRIQTITGSNFLSEDDFEAAMEQAGYWVLQKGGYNLTFGNADYLYYYYKEY